MRGAAHLFQVLRFFHFPGTAHHGFSLYLIVPDSSNYSVTYVPLRSLLLAYFVVWLYKSARCTHWRTRMGTCPKQITLKTLYMSYVVEKIVLYSVPTRVREIVKCFYRDLFNLLYSSSRRTQHFRTSCSLPHMSPNISHRLTVSHVYLRPTRSPPVSRSLIYEQFHKIQTKHYMYCFTVLPFWHPT